MGGLLRGEDGRKAENENSKFEIKHFHFSIENINRLTSMHTTLFALPGNYIFLSALKLDI